MGQPSVEIQVHTDFDHHGIWITWKELTAMVGGLCIMHDLSHCDGIEVGGWSDWVDSFERHYDDFNTIIDHDELNTLLKRLHDFNIDKIAKENDG